MKDSDMKDLDILKLNKGLINCVLNEATDNMTYCSYTVLDALDELMDSYCNHQDYELAGVVKQFKIDLVKKTGFLENSIDDKIKMLLK